VLVAYEETGRLRVEQLQHHKDGTPIHVDSLTIAMRDEHGETTGYLTINRDITERVRAEERLEEAREAERGRMARDLHDEALQELSGAMAYVQLPRTRPEEAHLRLEQLSAALKRTEQRVRSAVYDLGLGGERDKPFIELLENLIEIHSEMAPEIEISLEAERADFSEPLGRARSCCASLGRR
jgi:signal transduction histidine kinase